MLSARLVDHGHFKWGDQAKELEDSIEALEAAVKIKDTEILQQSQTIERLENRINSDEAVYKRLSDGIRSLCQEHHICP